MLIKEIVRLSSSQSFGFTMSFKHSSSISFLTIYKVKPEFTSKSRLLEEGSSCEES